MATLMRSCRRKPFCGLVDKLSLQKGIVIDYENIEGAGHVFKKDLEMMLGRVAVYVDKRLEDEALLLAPPEEESRRSRRRCRRSLHGQITSCFVALTGRQCGRPSLGWARRLCRES